MSVRFGSSRTNVKREVFTPLLRPGCVALKVGMTQVWDSWGVLHPVTVLFVDHNRIMQVKKSNPSEHGSPLFYNSHLVELGKGGGPTADTPGDGDGYNAVQVGGGGRKLKNVTSQLLGHSAAHSGVPGLTKDDVGGYGSDVSAPDVIHEFRVHRSVVDSVSSGERIHAMHFKAGQLLDVRGVTKGKGFAGGMKKHHFRGLPATHGVSRAHRAIGSTGQCQDPGRVFKGKKMAGHMGVEQRCAQNLKLLKIDRGRNLLFVRGAVPGNKGSWVIVKDAVKKPYEAKKFPNKPEGDTLPFPIYRPLPGEEGIDGNGKPGKDVWAPAQTEDPYKPEEIIG